MAIGVTEGVGIEAVVVVMEEVEVLGRDEDTVDDGDDDNEGQLCFVYQRKVINQLGSDCAQEAKFCYIHMYLQISH